MLVSLMPTAAIYKLLRCSSVLSLSNSWWIQYEKRVNLKKTVQNCCIAPDQIMQNSAESMK